MNRLFDPLRRLFEPIEPIKPGIYHYISPPDDPRNYRLHLRVEADGRGLLIVNAATVLHLNETATEYAYYLVNNVPVEDAAHRMSTRYRVNQAQAREDYLTLSERVLALIETPDLDPVTFLDFERQAPYSGVIHAPYRINCALTYRLDPGADPAYAPTGEVARELSTAEWKAILDKAWAAGVPHVIFTGGEPTLRDDLPELLAYAEGKGMVSGLLTDGLKLVDPAYLDGLLQTGLDHLLLLLQPELKEDWTALNHCLRADLFTAVHLTLDEDRLDQTPAVIKRLAEMGVHALSLTAATGVGEEALQAAADLAASLDLELVWDLPVPYSEHNPVALEVPAEESPTGAGRAWLYVEPDGDVRPGQGIDRILGNLATDLWEQVWKRDRLKVES